MRRYPGRPRPRPLISCRWRRGGSLGRGGRRSRKGRHRRDGGRRAVTRRTRAQTRGLASRRVAAVLVALFISRDSVAREGGRGGVGWERLEERGGKGL